MSCNALCHARHRHQAKRRKRYQPKFFVHVLVRRFRHTGLRNSPQQETIRPLWRMSRSFDDRCNVADGGSPNNARYEPEKRPNSQNP
jgi:hypothetical protein